MSDIFWDIIGSVTPSAATARLLVDIATAMVIAAFNIRAARKIANVVRDTRPALEHSVQKDTSEPLSLPLYPR